MELNIRTLVIISISFFFAGIIDSVSGGGGLLTLPTFFLTGFPVHLIAGTNQCSCLLGSITSLCRYIKNGKIYWASAISSAITSVAGSACGARLNLIVPEKFLQIIMVVVLPFIAAFVILNRNFGKDNRMDSLTQEQLLIRSVLIGFILGAYVGFYGAGGGTFILLAFTLFTRFDLLTASGNTKVCSTLATVSASITFSLADAVVWPVVFSATFFNIAGNYLGAGLALKNGERIIRPMFIMVLALLFIRLLGTVFL